MRFDIENKIIKLDTDQNKNYISIDNKDRFLTELYSGAGSGKGKNSGVFRVVDPTNDEPDCVIKFCVFHEQLAGDFFFKKRLRFEREIDALKLALNRGMNNLLSIIADSKESIDGYTFRYYVMESAEGDLGQYLEENRLELQQKMVLCVDMLKALKQLHELGIYHRDLKPDNIFFIGDQWKIGDLGFIAHRHEDIAIDGPKERIGPTALMSPEAVNKAFANTENNEYEIDCVINDMSDIFQMGKLFWYVLQGDLPTGQVDIDDFKVGDAEIFNNIVLPMIQNAKSRRPSMDVLEERLIPIKVRLVV